MTLDFARSRPIEPGANRRGDQADTTWLFLLPSLELREAVIVGPAPAGTVTALRGLADVAVAPDERRPPGPRVGLVYVGARRVAALARDESARAWLAEVLAAGGSAYLAPGRRQSMAAPAQLARLLGVDACVTVGAGPAGAEDAVGEAGAWLIPATAVAPSRLAPRAGAAIRAARRLALRVARRGGVGAPGRVSEPETALGIERTGDLPARLAPGTGILLRPPPADGRSLPEYLQRAAESQGAGFAPTGWRLAPPRGYRSQKVIFFTRLATGQPAVVKLTQEPRFNPLLENESAALERLADVPLGRALAVPSLHFNTRHAGLAVVAQSALAGKAFVRVAAPSPEGEHAESVLRALRALALATRRPSAGVTEALLEIANRYRSVYGETGAPGDRLERRLRQLDALDAELPVVFMHGDATVYNVLVAPGPRIGLVDWENAEPEGMPLWDLFHFRHAHAVWTAERGGMRYTPARFISDFLGAPGGVVDSPSLAAARHELGVPGEAMQPLMCAWLAWCAVREARQLDPARLENGFHHRVLATALRG